MDGIVKQLDSLGGIVIECSCVTECMNQNKDISILLRDNFTGRILKQCLLSVSEHGSRCMAYPQDSTTWIIDSDITKIKQIPTNDNIKRI